MFDQLVIGCPLNILAVGWFRTMSDDVGCCGMMLMLDIGEAPQWTCTLLVNVSRHWFYAVWLLWCVSIQASWNLFRAIDNYPLEYHQNICMCQQIRPPKDLSRSRNHQASDPINELNRSINNVHIYIYDHCIQRFHFHGPCGPKPWWQRHGCRRGQGARRAPMKSPLGPHNSKQCTIEGGTIMISCGRFFGSFPEVIYPLVIWTWQLEIHHLVCWFSPAMKLHLWRISQLAMDDTREYWYWSSMQGAGSGPWCPWWIHEEPSSMALQASYHIYTENTCRTTGPGPMFLDCWVASSNSPRIVPVFPSFYPEEFRVLSPDSHIAKFWHPGNLLEVFFLCWFLNHGMPCQCFRLVLLGPLGYHFGVFLRDFVPGKPSPLLLVLPLMNQDWYRDHPSLEVYGNLAELNISHISHFTLSWNDMILNGSRPAAYINRLVYFPLLEKWMHRLARPSFSQNS